MTCGQLFAPLNSDASRTKSVRIARRFSPRSRCGSQGHTRSAFIENKLRHASVSVFTSAVPPYDAITAQGTSFHEMCKKSERSATKAEADELPHNVARPNLGRPLK